jgi:hypothetical protein
VTLADMQEEYALVLSQLKLAGQIGDYHLHGMFLMVLLMADVQDLARHQRKWLACWSSEARSIWHYRPPRPFGST